MATDNIHSIGVVNLVYGPNLPTPRNSRVIKRTHVLIFVNKLPYIDIKPTATQSGEVIKIDTRKALDDKYDIAKIYIVTSE